MESKYIGRLVLQKYPKIELEETFTEKIDPFFLSNFYEDLNSKIKSKYTKYILHMIIAIIFGAVIFYLGFYFYETIFPLSVTFSVFFVAIFIYSSKAIEIKSNYFKFFRSFFLKSFISYCPLGYSFDIVSKKKKILIFLMRTI